MQQTLCEAIESGVLILTPNRRLSAEWHKHYATYKAQRGEMCYSTPRILPWTTWLNTLFDEAALHSEIEPPRLLSTTLSHYLWEGIVQSTTDTIPLLQPSRTALLLQKAYHILIDWRISLTDPELIPTLEDERANAWMKRYESLCEKNQWLDEARLSTWLLSHLQCIQSLLPKHYYLIGFNELTPQQQYFLENIQAYSKAYTLTHSNINIAEVKRVTLNHEKEEWEIAARFAKAHHTHHPHARIAIIIPDLEHKRDAIRHQFQAYFNEDEINISAGKPLPNYPIIHAAIQFLNLCHGYLPSDAITHLMNTPYLAGSEKEQMGRARLDLIRRENNIIQFNLKKLAPLHETWLQEHTPILFEKLTQFYEKLASLKKQSLTQWAKTFNELLTHLGWPGERILNSEEYQIVQAWLNLLADMQQLDIIAGELTINDALHCLTLMAHQTVFQAKSPEAPVQVLGLLEAAGLPFDALWLTGLDHQTWPAAPKPNPFIPKRLQREKNMPHATSERELLYCQYLMNQFLQKSPLVYFSYAKIKEDSERELSGLIKSYDTMTIDELRLAPLHRPVFTRTETELCHDIKAPPVTDLKLNGGVTIIKLQAQCPFKAFAECRLDAKPLPEPEPGLSAKERGILLHSALESFWQKTQSHQSLITLSESELKAQIDEAIILAFNSTKLPYAKTSHYMQLEKQRLHTLLTEWLALEKQRPPFHVLTHEKSVSLPLAALTIAARIDRIDTLDNGDKIIIDYKTGKQHKPAGWFHERPDDPQLPLYTLVDPTQTKALSFAKLVSGQCEFSGVSDTNIDIKGIYALDKLRQENKQATWDDQLAAWQSQFIALASQYANGDARVEPKHPEQSCEHCELPSFCRINEQGR